MSANAHALSPGLIGLDIKDDGARFIISFPHDEIAQFDSDRDGAVAYEEINSRRSEVLDYINGNFRVEFEDEAGATVASENLMVMDDVPVLMKDYTFSRLPETVRIVATQGDWEAVVKKGGERRALFINDADRNPEFDFSQSGALLNSLWLGVGHILKGYDHLLFLLALLLTGSFRTWVKAATAFTLAHTLTLYLGAEGVVSVPAALVEALIAISISLSVLPVLVARLQKWESKFWMLVGLMGLVHGLGFAGYITEKLQGGSYLLATLFGFNAGVELGQLVFMAAVGSLLLFLRQRLFNGRLIYIMGVAIFIIGLGITFSRIPNLIS